MIYNIKFAQKAIRCANFFTHLIIYYKRRNNIGTIMPTKNRIPPLPQNPFGPFTITMPVSVISTSETAKISLNVVHHLPGL
jgi:hypothetical protein